MEKNFGHCFSGIVFIHVLCASKDSALQVVIETAKHPIGMCRRAAAQCVSMLHLFALAMDDVGVAGYVLCWWYTLVVVHGGTGNFQNRRHQGHYENACSGHFGCCIYGHVF